MEVSNKKITSPFFAFLFISSLLIQCFPCVSSKPIPGGKYNKPVPNPGPINPVPNPGQPLPNPTTPGGKKFCVPKPEATDKKLTACIKWVCKEGGVDCGPINPGGACSQPNTLRSRATWAMNAYFQMKGKTDSMCGFSGTGVVSSIDPSYGTCKYQS
ncbi:major pollen allergen Ole e 10 [Capsicum annuum]|uniref:major pollen allergen Ole e 10 n=1 Tax=Capsicum annuum TaxID=4072 RepID=UPI0007BECD8B|nr:major pollen allergen Ole e 10 [Capsicum annuum]